MAAIHGPAGGQIHTDTSSPKGAIDGTKVTYIEEKREEMTVMTENSVINGDSVMTRESVMTGDSVITEEV